MFHFCHVTDLNAELGEAAGLCTRSGAHARRTAGVRAIDGASVHCRPFVASSSAIAGDRRVREFSCANQYRCMAFAQLAYRESLRDIEICLRAQAAKLFHLGIRGAVAKSALADANESRDWRIYAEFAQHLIRIARRLYVDEHFGVDLKEMVYALDSTTIDLCLTLLPWVPFRSTKAVIKLHTLIDLRGNIPSFIHISDRKLHDVNVLDELLPEAGAFYVMDRGYLDFERLHRLHLAKAFFVTRAKSNLKATRRYSHPVDRSTGLICDQTITLTVFCSKVVFPDTLRRIRFKIDEGKTLVFLTNNFTLSALTTKELYRCRWQVELFFKWIKQHLRIKSFFGTGERGQDPSVYRGERLCARRHRAQAPDPGCFVV